jgi:hypothetical protein
MDLSQNLACVLGDIDGPWEQPEKLVDKLMGLGRTHLNRPCCLCV